MIASGVRGAKQATSVAFVASGFAFASWASRIPQVRDGLGVSPAALGLILLSLSFGSLVALPTAGSVIHRFGTGRTVAAMAVLLGAGLVIAGVGYRFGALPLVAGLVLVGVGNAAWDVAMNVHGAAVERRLDRAIMPRFHAGFSIGTVAGALGGVLAVGLGVPVTAHLCVVGLVVALTVPRATRSFLAASSDSADSESASSGSANAASDGSEPVGELTALGAWREPRTLLIGVFVLCAAFTEGTGNDWLGVAVVDGYDSSLVVGTVAFAVFLAGMTAARWLGPGLIDRFGRVPVLRVSICIALAGLVLVVLGLDLPLALVGTVLWGSGAALGFPVGMSAAADDPHSAHRRVSVVSSIGYTAFLAGPPLIGFLGDHVGVLRALTVAAALLALAAAIVPVTRERAAPVS